MTINWQSNVSQLPQTPVAQRTIAEYLRDIYLGQQATPEQTVENVAAMKRIIIIGSSGSGKSTLARQLSKQLDLPVIHLDKHFWHPGWVGTPHHVWVQRIRKFVQGDKWIIDGNYRSTLDIRLEAADTAIFLDLPRWLCTWRATKRRIQYRNRPRPDMAPGCQEKIFDPSFPKFLQWIWDYPNRARPNVVRRLRELDGHKRLIWLRSSKDVEQFLENPQQWHNRPTPVNEIYEYIAKLEG